MSNPQSNFVTVADLKEFPEGTPKAVRVEGRSIALFQHQGSVYATDNQCPHMGYPLTRGRVRNGVLTCDWHGWSYDMKAAAVSPEDATTSTRFPSKCGTTPSTSTCAAVGPSARMPPSPAERRLVELGQLDPVQGDRDHAAKVCPNKTP